MGALAVFLAAAAGFATGAIWYGILGRRWAAALGKTEAQYKSERSTMPFVIAALGTLATAGMLRHVFVASGISSGGAGFVAGFGVGAFVVLPWILMNYAFSGRPRDLWWIDGGHAVLACALIGLVLGLMG
ncbi:DUF1761 domain-containing protein [Limibaculum sp. M0105]|uniref:DUF1761 domain-containing protein n=1 Tax=Thermohalobaculum xanthum TaxID=2753746 RepID=A0A8J7MAN8_9RHOB|nr:DUF1761 domain-containing protein [Thermohalobaculum xanthum]MBK0400584.1 DUF1761 domain-containing protein [Thermohalobaculum xanthum]